MFLALDEGFDAMAAVVAQGTQNFLWHFPLAAKSHVRNDPGD